MAVRFLIAFILVSCGASAQVFQTNNVPYKFRGLKADSMLVVPSGADTANLANPKWGENMNGALFAKTGDSTLWMKVGTRWVKVTGTSLDTTSLSNRINQKVDSITSSNDSLYYYVNGTQYYVSSFTGFDTAVVVKAQVHNAESTTLLAGEVVYSFGATGNLMSVKRAWNKQDATSAKTFGVVRKDIPAGGTGWIVTNGVVDKLNLGAYTEGDQVYLDSIPGKFTATKPYAPYHMVAVGVIERANNGNGQIYVKVQNGYELDELHNVSARFPSNNQVLKFRASDSLWHNATDTGITSLTAGVGLTGGTITTTGTIAADTNVLSTRAWRQKGLDSLAALELSLNDTAAMLNPYARGTGAANQVAFWNGTRSLSGSNNFTFNNRRVGIGTSAPNSTLQVFQNTIDSNLTALNISGYNITQNNAQSAVDISGTWNTIGTPSLIKANVTNTASNSASLLMDLQVGGSSYFRFRRTGELVFSNASNVTLSPAIYPATTSSNVNGTNLHFLSNTTTQIASNGSFYFSGFNFISPTNEQNNIVSQRTFAPGSGSAIHSNFIINSTINQTGGANGITRGLFVNPTLTAAADWRSIEWSNNTGRGLWGTGTASNALAGPTTIGAAASPSASAVLDLTSTTRGFLPPRMTAAQRTGIANAAGLLVWDSDSARYLLNNGTSWRGLAYTGEGGGGSAAGATSNIQFNSSGSFAGSSRLIFTQANIGGATEQSNVKIGPGNHYAANGYGFLSITGNDGAGFAVHSTDSTARFRLGVDKTTGAAMGTFSNHKFDLYVNGNIRMSMPSNNGRDILFNGATGLNIASYNMVATSGVSGSYFQTQQTANGATASIGSESGENYILSSNHRLNIRTNNINRIVIPTTGNVIINSNSDVASSQFTIVSTTKGAISAPIMTSTERNAISTPAEGLRIYNNTDKTNDVYDGTRWNNTPNGLKNSATLDFGSTSAQTSADLTITVTGAAEGDMVFLGTPNGAVNANTNFTAWVSAANTVTIRFNNYSSGSVDPASGTFRVYVIKN